MPFNNLAGVHRGMSCWWMGKSRHENIDEPTKHVSQHLAGAQSNHCEDQQRCVALVQRNVVF